MASEYCTMVTTPGPSWFWLRRPEKSTPAAEAPWGTHQTATRNMARLRNAAGDQEFRTAPFPSIPGDPSKQIDEGLFKTPPGNTIVCPLSAL
jgi:hypothetical protein